MVRSDHQALVYIFKLKEPKGRTARWLEVLSAYQFSVEYRKGIKHSNADTMSRCLDPWHCQCPEDNTEPLKCGPCKKCKKRSQETSMSWTLRKERNGATSEVNVESSSQVLDNKTPEGNEDARKTDSLRTIRSEPEKQETLSSQSAEGGGLNTKINTTEQPSTSKAEGTPRRSPRLNPKQTELCNAWLSSQNREKLKKLQENDPDIGPILNAMCKGQRPDHSQIVSCSPATRHYWSIWDVLLLKDGLLFKQFHKRDGSGSHLQFIVPRDLKREIMFQMHDTLLSAHLGARKTQERAIQRFYWYDMRDQIHNWVQTCQVCASIKKPCKTPCAPLGTMPVGAPMDRLATDLLGPLPLTPRGNRYILLVTDHFSKWVEIMAVPNQTAEICAEKILNEVIGRYGCPLTIHSDQGRCYESAIFTELCEMLDIKKTRTSPRNPKCNGQSELFNRTLLSMIKAFLKDEQSDWDLHLGCLAAAYRATPHASTGLTPNLLMLGREVRLPVDLIYGGIPNENGETISYGDYVDQLQNRMQRAHDIARKHLGEAAKRQKEIYDSKLCLHSYQTGDLVWYLEESKREGVSPKLQPSYHGPCIITQKINDLIYKIQIHEDGACKVVHHIKLKPYLAENIPKWARKSAQKLKIKPANQQTK